MEKKMYVSADEIARDWDVSRSTAYNIIKDLNRKLLEINPNHIVISGKTSRKFYEENCYGRK